METAEWLRLAPVLDELLEMEPGARELRLLQLERESPELAAEVHRLLALDTARPDFLSTPAYHESICVSLPGALVGPYRLLKQIGEGGMGQVWLAERADGLFERRAALKLLRPGFADTGLRTRFDRERQILAKLAHEHIARFLDAGFGDDGQPYLALEYVEGQGITAYATQRKLTVVQRLALFLQVCSAVSHAHASLVVHRDLKPSNILVTPAGAVRLLDFGIAKLLDAPGRETTETTRAGSRAFTLHYAAPEQIRGEAVTATTDVYSLGVVLYELLTGCKPYRLRRDTDAEWEEAILNSDPTRPSSMARSRDDHLTRSERKLARTLSGDLDNIVLKALHKAPEDRYLSVEALASDLRRYLAGRPVSARPHSLDYRLRKYVQRNALQIGLGLGIIVVLGSALYVALWQARQARAETQRAQAETQRAQAMHDFMVGLFEQAEQESGPTNAVDIRRLLDAGVRRTNTQFAHQPITRAELLALIARMDLRLGDYSKAIAVLDQQKSTLFLAPQTVQIESLSLRGDALRQLGDPGLCRTTMLAHENEFDDHSDEARRLTAQYQSVLGRCERALQHVAPARAHFQRALAMRKSQDNAAAEAESLVDLAMLEADTGHNTTALTGLLDALRRLSAAHSEQGPLAINIWLELGTLYRELGRSSEAENAYRTSYRLATGLYGSGHPATIDAERGLAAIYVDQGKLDLAEPLFVQAEQQLTRLLGPNHPDLGSMSNSLGIIAWERGDLATAESRLRRALQLWAQSPRLAGGMFNLAMVLHNAGRDSEAEPLVREALALREHQFGTTHGLVGTSLRLIGEIKLAEHDIPAAEPLLQHAFEILRADYGPAHSATGQAELALARLRVAQLRPADAMILIAGILRGFAPSDADHRRLLWAARTLAAQLQCAQPGIAAQGRRNLQQIRREVVAELPVSVIARETDAALRGCGG
jgi:serine/threonine protein kinase/Flp pilus assembly protein TadD